LRRNSQTESACPYARAAGQIDRGGQWLPHLGQGVEISTEPSPQKNRSAWKQMEPARFLRVRAQRTNPIGSVCILSGFRVPGGCKSHLPGIPAASIPRPALIRPVAIICTRLRRLCLRQAWNPLMLGPMRKRTEPPQNRLQTECGVRCFRETALARSNGRLRQPQVVRRATDRSNSSL
jgi:hypothetical protein